MNRLALILPVLVAACAAPLGFEKSGVRPQAAQNDLVNCKVEALGKVPPNNAIRSMPTGLLTAGTGCRRRHGGRHCVGLAYESRPALYTVDTNSSLRRQVTQQCMRHKGYRLVRQE